VRGLEVVARATHVEEWDETAALQAAVALKRAEAGLATSLVEAWLAEREGRQPSPRVQRQAPGIALQLLDRALAGLHLELLSLHLQVQDPRSSSCMGLRLGRLSIAPVAKARQQRGDAAAPPTPGDDVAVPRQVEMEDARLHVNPTLSVGKEERDGHAPPNAAAAAPLPLHIGQIDLLVARVGLPEIGAVLCAAGRRPNGQARRLTISGDIHGLRLELRAPQIQHFVFHLLHVFYGGEFAAWRNAVIMKHREACRPLTPLERERYLQLDRAGKSSKPAVGGEGQQERASSSHEVALLAQERESLESRMSYAEIVRLRCQARGWGPRLLRVASQEHGGDDDRWLERELLPTPGTGTGAGEGQQDDEEWRALALAVGRARAHHWHENRRIREFWLERVNIEKLEVRGFDLKGCVLLTN
jgi:hypothetical protein